MQTIVPGLSGSQDSPTRLALQPVRPAKKAKIALRSARKQHFTVGFELGVLVLAAGLEDCKDHQIRIREEPLLGLRLGSFGRARYFPKVFVLGKGSKVILADACQPGNLIFCEEFLARLDSDHVSRLSVPSMLIQA
jgi:hypothetical protein